MHETVNRGKNNNKYMKYHSELTYQLSFWNVSRKVDYHARQVVHPRPQTPQGESVAKPKTHLLIIFIIACKYEVLGNLFSPLFEKQNPWTKTS